MRPKTHYLRTGEQGIAYQVFGEGRLDLVWVTGMNSHVDARWDAPRQAAALNRLASFSRVICFDRRGSGASDPLGGDRLPSWEAWADDLAAVLDALDCSRVALFATLDGGPVALLFAAVHPDRVSALVLGNTAARYVADETFPEGVTAEQAESLLGTVERGWGTEDYAALTSPGFTTEEIAAVARFQRTAASPATAAAQFRQVLSLDVRDALPAIQAPTLVLHRTDFPFVPVRLGRHLADAIPHTEYVEFPGASGLVGSPDGDEVLDVVEEFLTGAPPVVRNDRRLAAVLFTDITSSTERVAAIGDRAWRALIERHDGATAAAVDRFGGRLVKGTGDGALAIFDRPSLAVSCATELLETVAEMGLRIRAGIHVGEVETRGQDIAGLAVHVAARIESLADPGELLVSRTVVDLMPGADVTVNDRGTHALKGIEGEWQLFGVEASSVSA